MLNVYRDSTQQLCEMKGWNKAPINTVWLLFTEEIGELASAIRQYTKVGATLIVEVASLTTSPQVYQKTNLQKERGTDVQMEMGDVFSYLFQLASMLNVDLDDMWHKHRTKVR